MVMEPADANHHENAVVPEIQDDMTTVSQQSDAVVPMVCLYLTESVRVAPCHSVVIPVQMEEGWMVVCDSLHIDFGLVVHLFPHQSSRESGLTSLLHQVVNQTVAVEVG